MDVSNAEPFETFFNIFYLAIFFLFQMRYVNLGVHGICMRLSFLYSMSFQERPGGDFTED